MKATYKDIFVNVEPDIINTHLGWYYLGDPVFGIICKSEAAYTICQAMKRYAQRNNLFCCNEEDIDKCSPKTRAILNYSLAAENIMLDALGIKDDSDMIIQLDKWFEQEYEMSENDNFSIAAVNILRTLPPMNKRNNINKELYIRSIH